MNLRKRILISLGIILFLYLFIYKPILVNILSNKILVQELYMQECINDVNNKNIYKYTRIEGAINNGYNKGDEYKSINYNLINENYCIYKSKLKISSQELKDIDFLFLGKDTIKERFSYDKKSYDMELYLKYLYDEIMMFFNEKKYNELKKDNNILLINQQNELLQFYIKKFTKLHIPLNQLSKYYNISIRDLIFIILKSQLPDEEIKNTFKYPPTLKEPFVESLLTSHFNDKNIFINKYFYKNIYKKCKEKDNDNEFCKDLNLITENIEGNGIPKIFILKELFILEKKGIIINEKELEKVLMKNLIKTIPSRKEYWERLFKSIKGT